MVNIINFQTVKGGGHGWKKNFFLFQVILTIVGGSDIPPTHFFDYFYASNNSIIGRAKRAPHWGVQSRFHVNIYTCHVPKKIGGISWPKHVHTQSQFGRLKPTCDTRVIHFDYMLEQL